MRAGPDERQLAVAVRQRLRRPGQAVLGPGGVGERAVGADPDGLAFGVDLARFFPVLADGPGPPETRPDRLGISTGSKLPALSRGTSSPTGPIPVYIFLAIVPLRELPVLCPARSRRS
jgi:hypothetical protein